jgi:pimeloyl-ACP methyl ester carboxylesterase
MNWRAGMLLGLVIGLGADAAPAQGAQVLDLPTRPGVTQRVLVERPAQPAAVLILMAGGSGRLGILANGELRNDRNFLVRSRRLFVQQGYAVVLPDTPSDHSRPPFLDGRLRESAEHAADLGAVIAWAHGRFARPVWIVGTSRGTQSAAHAAVTLTGAAAPDGLVLASTILASDRRAPAARPVQEMGLEQLRIPVLVAHHEQDQCPACPPALLPQLMDKLKGTTARLVTYRGGSSSGPACKPFAHHGFNGVESRVVDDIAAWIASQPAPPR